MRDRATPRHRKEATTAAAILELITRDPQLRDAKALRGLSQFLLDLGALLRYAAQEGFALGWGHTSRAQPGPVMEFYFDLYKGSQSQCYISKGWNDPGVRIGDVLRISREDEGRIKQHIKPLVDACASQGVSLQLLAGAGGAVELHVWTPVYGSAVTPRGLHEAVKALQECKRRIRRICPFTCGAPR